MGKLDGKVAIVTGAASGIGAATAALFGREGASVVLADLDGVGAESGAASIVAAGGDAMGVRADLGSQADLEHLFEVTLDRHGRLDVLHNNGFPVGLGVRDLLIHAADPALWDEMFHVGVTGTMMATKLALAPMLERRRGVIVNTASLAGLMGDARGHAAYAACKAAILALTRSTATLYGGEGIRCNAISPGHILSPPVKAVFGEERQAALLRHYPSTRLGEPDDIAAVALFLASDDAAFVNGANVVADGGFTVPMGTFAHDFDDVGPASGRE